MKKSLLILGVILLLAGGCRNYTCPTYTKEDVKEVKSQEEKI